MSYTWPGVADGGFCVASQVETMHAHTHSFLKTRLDAQYLSLPCLRGQAEYIKNECVYVFELKYLGKEGWPVDNDCFFFLFF